MSTGSLTKRAISAHEKALSDLDNLQREMARKEKLEAAFRQHLRAEITIQQDFPEAIAAIATFIRVNWPTILKEEVERREKSVADTSEALAGALEADRRERERQAHRCAASDAEGRE